MKKITELTRNLADAERVYQAIERKESAAVSSTAPTDMERRVAAKLGDDPHAIAKRRVLIEAMEEAVDGYVKGYDYDDGEHSHDLSENERIYVEDAVQGLLADDDFVRTFNAWQDAVREATPSAIRLPDDVILAMRVAADRLRGGGTFPIRGESWQKLDAALRKYASTEGGAKV